MQLLWWAFKGEIFGEALFEALQRVFPDRANQLATLAELESSMAEALMPVLARHGVDHRDSERSRSAGLTAAEALGAAGWREFIAQFDDATTEALGKYRRLRSMATGPDIPAIDLLIAHEEALQAFAAEHVAGHHEEALDDVRRVLTGLKDASAR